MRHLLTTLAAAASIHHSENHSTSEVASRKQLEANRINAQRSTGPKAPTEKLAPE